MDAQESKMDSIERSRRNMHFTDEAMEAITDKQLECTQSQVEMAKAFFGMARGSLIGLSRRDQQALTFLLAEELQVVLFRFEVYVNHWRQSKYNQPTAASDTRIEKWLDMAGTFGDKSRFCAVLNGDYNYFT